MRTGTRQLIVLASLFSAVGCERGAERRPSLTLTQVRPENHVGVFLNERIQLHFSEALDPTSVHGRSVRITSTAGIPARGELYVAEERLTFVPDPVLAFDLSDGGYLPGTTYHVDLAGFPEVDGLRGRSGTTLARNLRWEFRSATVTEPRAGFVFEDSSLARGLRVVLRSAAIQRGDPIVLEGEEPLDPSTLFGEDFVLRRKLVEEQAQRVRPPMSPPIPLRARMRENHDFNDPLARGTALIELTAVDRLLEPGSYWLDVDPEQLRLRDFGGNRLRLREPLEFSVVARASGPEESTWFLESFHELARRSPQSPEGFDGTARWSGSGRVELRWPAAAGDGLDGEVSLGAREPRRVVNATRIELPEGQRCELDATPGLVVLKAQGKLHIAGDLLRRTGSSDALTRTVELFTQPSDGYTLSQCLERAAAQSLDATILIAGGDLVIDGRIDCDHPVLLVAGGRIRAARADVVGASVIYYCGDGTGLVNRNARDGRALNPVRATCTIDEPPAGGVNPLVAPLRLAVVSAPIPPVGRAVRWHVAPHVGADPGSGALRVRYLGERVDSGGRYTREVIVDDPGALTDCPTLRLQVELVMPAGEDAPTWRPPWVDFVLVEFDRAAGSAR